jgi:predicted PurR-regulated permease PerM
VLYTLVQQVENNVLVPKIQGDAVELHPAIVMFAIIVGGSLGGLLGAILALPITAAMRDVVRYLFRRLSPDSPDALAASITGLGLEHHPGIHGVTGPTGDPAVPAP